MFQGGKAVSKYPGVQVKTSTSVIPGGDPESSRIPIKYDKSFNAEGRPSTSSGQAVCRGGNLIRGKGGYHKSDESCLAQGRRERS